MNQIFPHLLWLGHAGEGRDFRRLFDAGIKALVELAAEELPSQPPRELIYCRFPLVDGTGNDPGLLSLATGTVMALLQQRVPVLVCCGIGLSRSPVVAAGALSLIHRESPQEWLERVTEQHPADVSPGLWKDLTDLLPTLATRWHPVQG